MSAPTRPAYAPATSRRPAVATTRDELSAALAGTRERGGRVALVPTMGALHRGHAALMGTARELVGEGGALVASIFVNPMQFGPAEDLSRYPRTLDEDLAMCAEQGVDVVFAPSVDQVYPGGEPQVGIDPGPLAKVLEGQSRPTHFRGVLVVVAKLFGLVRPDLAVFGEKDYQQLVLIRRMVEDLCLDIEVFGAETVREPDGLALSSRNRYLDGHQRQAALALSAALRRGAQAAGDGLEAALTAARAALHDTAGVDLDYLALTSPELDEAPASGPARMLVAARVGNTRLIDNIAVHLGRIGPSNPANSSQ